MGEAKSFEVLTAELLESYQEAEGHYTVNHTVQLTSYGGSGTTALGDHLFSLGVDLPRSPGQWPFKHGRRPPEAAAVPERYRVLYLLGDPRDAVLSVFRRDFQTAHFRGLNDREPDGAEAARLESISTFLAAGVDDFALADHVDNWLNHPPGYPVMVLRLSEIDAAWPDVVEFLELPPDAEPFRLSGRHSDWSSVPADHRVALDAMYGDLAARIEAMPPARIV